MICGERLVSVEITDEKTGKTKTTIACKNCWRGNENELANIVFGVMRVAE